MSLEIGLDKLRTWRAHPAAMVTDLFGHLLPAGIDVWQRDVFEDFPHSPLQGMACCKGPGKTFVLAMIGWNFLLTRTHAKGAAVSVTGDNLDANLWAELAKWRKASPLLTSQFEMTATQIYQRQHPDTWALYRRTWSKTANEEELGNTLAGLWSAPMSSEMRTGVIFLIDEAGGVPVPILRTAEAALQREGTEGHVVMAGNCTQNDGALYHAAVLHRGQWRLYEITADPDDPNRTPRISLEYARQQIRLHGRDNPWVMINILAKFPKQGVNQLIGPDQVRECFGRHLHLHAYDWAARILGVDVADFGDDRTVIFPRQGLAYFPPIVLRQMDSVQVAGHTGDKANTWGAHSIQIDTTGGYGSGPASILRSQGFSSVLGVEFASNAINPKFYNKRAEIIWEFVENLKAGASLPRVDTLGQSIEDIVGELTTPTYSYKGDQIIIEPKDLIKKRLGRSPDLMEAGACSHAFPVGVPAKTERELSIFDMGQRSTQSRNDYDPLQRE